MPLLSSSRRPAPADPGAGVSQDFIGLKNQGKTCHLDPVLQALFTTREFRLPLHDCAAGSPPDCCTSMSTREDSKGTGLAPAGSRSAQAGVSILL